MSKKDPISQILDRYCEKIYPSKKAFLEKIAKEKICIYIGIDPTGPDLHIGHSTNFFVLKRLQELGHTVILLIGDFTARIGDPTDKLATRKRLSKEEVLKNAENYKKQVGKILNFGGKNTSLLKFNSEWLEKMSLGEIIELAAHVTLDQLKKREMFRKREREEREIYVHEFLYPLMQGYDSVAMDVDAELGGTDQTFNMLVGRDLVKAYAGKEKFVITTKLLENPKTGKKIMNKSEGSYVSLQANASGMYGGVMSLSDDVVITCFELCTEVPLVEIAEFERRLKTGENPMNLKKILAKEIVKIYHGEKAAVEAEKEFEKVVQAGELPSEIPVKQIAKGQWQLVDLLVECKLASSKSEAKRLIEQGAVEIDNQRITEPTRQIEPKDDTVIRAGKRKFVRIRLT